MRAVCPEGLLSEGLAGVWTVTKCLSSSRKQVPHPSLASFVLLHNQFSHYPLLSSQLGVSSNQLHPLRLHQLVSKPANSSSPGTKLQGITPTPAGSGGSSSSQAPQGSHKVLPEGGLRDNRAHGLSMRGWRYNYPPGSEGIPSPSRTLLGGHSLR